MEFIWWIVGWLFFLAPFEFLAWHVRARNRIKQSQGLIGDSYLSVIWWKDSWEIMKKSKNPWGV